MRVKRYTGPQAYIGQMGSGKTYHLVKRAKEALDDGRQVFTNRGFEVQGCETYNSFEEMLLVPPRSTILLDEGPVMFNARNWQEFPDGVLYRLTQVRKDDLQFFYSAISEEMVDKNLRNVTFWYHHCRHLMGPVFLRSMWAPHVWRKAKAKPYRRDFFTIKKSIADLYDTNAKVALRYSYLQKLRDASDDPWVEVLEGESLPQLLERIFGPKDRKPVSFPNGKSEGSLTVGEPPQKLSPKGGDASPVGLVSGVRGFGHTQSRTTAKPARRDAQ